MYIVHAYRISSTEGIFSMLICARDVVIFSDIFSLIFKWIWVKSLLYTKPANIFDTIQRSNLPTVHIPWRKRWKPRVSDPWTKFLIATANWIESFYFSKVPYPYTVLECLNNAWNSFLVYIFLWILFSISFCWLDETFIIWSSFNIVRLNLVFIYSIYDTQRYFTLDCVVCKRIEFPTCDASLYGDTQCTDSLVRAKFNSFTHNQI